MIEDTREPDARGDREFEQLVDAFDAGKLDAEFVEWAVSNRVLHTGDAIAEARNDGAARVIYQDFVAEGIRRQRDGQASIVFDDWLCQCAPDLHADEIATILREEDADRDRADAEASATVGPASNLRDDDHGWRPCKEFLAYQWEQRSS